MKHRPRYLTPVQQLEVAKEIIQSRSLKGTAHKFKLHYNTVYRVFRERIEVVWKLRQEPVQHDLFGELPKYRDEI